MAKGLEDEALETEKAFATNNGWGACDMARYYMIDERVLTIGQVHADYEYEDGVDHLRYPRLEGLNYVKC